MARGAASSSTRGRRARRAHRCAGHLPIPSTPSETTTPSATTTASTTPAATTAAFFIASASTSYSVTAVATTLPPTSSCQVPVWDLSGWTHPGGPFVQAASLCGSVRHGWLAKGSHSAMGADPEAGEELMGGGVKVGEYLDPAFPISDCASSRMMYWDMSGTAAAAPETAMAARGIGLPLNLDPHGSTLIGIR